MPKTNFFNPDTDKVKVNLPEGSMRISDIDRYVTHEEVTNEELHFQLGFKPHESEYFGDGYQLTNL